MKKFGAVILAGILGFIFTLGAMLIITGVIGAAMAQDQTTATRPARLGEQNRSMNYQGTPETYEDFAYIVEAESTASTDTDVSCQQHNVYLRYMLVDIAKTIARNPKIGYIFKGAIQTINDSWCR